MLESVLLCVALMSRSLSVTLSLVSLGLQPGCNGVFERKRVRKGRRKAHMPTVG